MLPINDEARTNGEISIFDIEYVGLTRFDIKFASLLKYDTEHTNSFKT